MRNPEKIASRWQELYNKPKAEVHPGHKGPKEEGGKDSACVALNQDPINYTFSKKCQLYFRLPHEAPVHRERGICNPHLFFIFNSELLSVQNVRTGESKQQARTNIFVT